MESRGKDQICYGFEKDNNNQFFHICAVEFSRIEFFRMGLNQAPLMSIS